MSSSGQTKSARLKSINAFVYKTDTDKSILRKQDTTKTGKEICVCQAIDIYIKSDSLLKITTWGWHVSILKTEYYYISNKLVFVRQTKDYDHKLLEKREYYFRNEQVISVIDNAKPNRKSRRETGRYFHQTGNDILNNIASQ